MKTPEEFEREYRRMPVKVLDDATGSGVLHLDGANTLLQTTGHDQQWIGKPDENGWFDLRVQSQQGKKLLLRRSICVGSRTFHLGEKSSPSHSSEIYPNFVIEDVSRLDEQARVNGIRFQLPGLTNFFYYRYVEPLFLPVGPEKSEVQVALRSMRAGSAPDDVFEPEMLYVAHRFPEFISFEIEDRTYKVFAGGTSSFGLQKISHQRFPIASISFSEPVDFVAAFERAWEWRRLYSQMAMLFLPFKSMAVDGPEQGQGCDVYLTNQAHKKAPEESYYKLSPAEQPFNQWNERDQLAQAHKAWLMAEPARQTFRAKIDKVVDGFSSKTDTNYLTQLSSAIDSLSEIEDSWKLPREALSAMANAAIAEAKNHKLDVPLDRIKGLLGSLARPSLSQKMEALGQRVSASSTDIALISKAAVRARNLAAHGGTLADQAIAAIRPTIEALLALCVRFDLETSGFPTRTSGGSKTMPTLRFEHAVRDLDVA